MADRRRLHCGQTTSARRDTPQYARQTLAQIELAIAYNDAEMPLDIKDVPHQIVWLNGREVIDQCYVIPLPAR